MRAEGLSGNQQKGEVAWLAVATSKWSALGSILKDIVDESDMGLHKEQWYQERPYFYTSILKDRVVISRCEEY